MFLFFFPVFFGVMNDVGMPVESLYFRAMILRVQ